MAHGDGQCSLGGERGQFGLPGTGAVAVRAASVGGDEQPFDAGIGSVADAIPPAADRLDGERGGVVVGADIDPAGVRRDVVDPVRHGLVEFLVAEVMGVDLHPLTLGPPLAPGRS